MNRNQRNWTNVMVQSQGGSINVAQLVTRLESNTGSVLLEWLRSIPKYPKAFKLKMQPISDLLNINVRRLFIDEIVNVSKPQKQQQQQKQQTCKRSFDRSCAHGTSVEEFQSEFDKRRESLKLAIDIFRHKVILLFNLNSNKKIIILIFCLFCFV